MSHVLELRPVRSQEIAQWAQLTMEGLPCEDLPDEAEYARVFVDEPEESRRTAYLAWSGDRPVARLRLQQEDDSATTWAIGLAADLQSPELAAAVVAAIEDWARTAHARQLSAEVGADLAGAFVATGHRPRRLRVRMRAKLERRPAPCPLPMREVHLASEEELQAIARLYYESYLGTIDDEGEGPEGALAEVRHIAEGQYGTFLAACSLALEHDGRLAGAALVTEWREAALLAEVMIQPDHRGRGYARPLIQAAMNACLDAGWQEMVLTVTLGNVPAEGLYRRMGFRPDSGCEWHFFEKDLDGDGNASTASVRSTEIP